MTDVSLKPSATWGRLWQVPLAIVGAVAFGYGVRQLAASRKQVPFDTHVRDVEALIGQKRYDAAVKQINTLAGVFGKKPQQAQLEALAADAFYHVHEDAVVDGARDEANARLAAEHYQKAVDLGWPVNTDIDVAWGESALAAGDTQLAIKHLEQAIAVDPAEAVRHARALVNAYLGQTPPATGKALAMLDRWLAVPRINVDDRAWALCKKIELTLGQPGVDGAIATARQALKTMPERGPAGAVLTWIGRADYDAGRLDAAKESLTLARKQFVVPTPDDGRAAFLLGKIAQLRGEADAAKALFQEVITSHAGAAVWAAARMGRAELQSADGPPGPQVVADYEFAISAANHGVIPSTAEVPEFLSKQTVRASLNDQFQRASRGGEVKTALVFLALERQVNAPITPANMADEAVTEERRGDELMASAAAQGDEQGGDYQEALGHYGLAAEAYWKHSEMATLTDPVLWANSQWKSAQLFDRAGRAERSIEAYQRFMTDHPRDARVPESLYAVGRLEESLGKFDRAIETFGRNVLENSKTPAAYLSTIELARCYMATGPADYAKAETVLLAMVQDNKDIQPSANEFRLGLFTLGELYYRWGRWSDAILKLDEALQRYPNDAVASRATFWLAESYRQSAREIAEALGRDPQVETRQQLTAARRQRLVLAGGLYGRVIDHLEGSGEGAAARGGDAAPRTAIEGEYLRMSYLNRAEVVYDLGSYREAISLYSQAADRFGETTQAVEAYVQVVNAYLKLHEPAQASAAAERARWLLKRLPNEAFEKQPVKLSRRDYEAFLSLARRDP